VGKTVLGRASKLASSFLGSIVLAAFMVVGVTAAPASAAAGDVEVSADGVTFGSTYSGALFDDLALMVPGDSQSTVLYVRNSGTEPGFLRISLQDVVTSDADYADALTVTVSTGAAQGTATAVSAANPCWVLLQGEIISPGQVVAVSSTAALGNLGGLAGQGATASLALKVGLSSTGTGSLPPTSCGGSGTTVPVTPPVTPTATPAPGVQGGAAGTGAAADTGTTTSPQEPDVDLPVLNLPELLGIDPNTWHLWEELFALLLLLSCILGGLVFALVARQRRRHDDQDQENPA